MPCQYEFELEGTKPREHLRLPLLHLPQHRRAHREVCQQVTDVSHEKAPQKRPPGLHRIYGRQHDMLVQRDEQEDVRELVERDVDFDGRVGQERLGVCGMGDAER